LTKGGRNLYDAGAQSKDESAYGEPEPCNAILSTRAERQYQEERRERGANTEIKASLNDARIAIGDASKQE
jgi:hypothetical protein